MSTARTALENIGIKVEKYYSSEIKPYANKLTQYHYPDTIQLGDVTKWREWDINWAEIDMICSGSPCQDLSIAGKRKGLKGENSSLFWVFIDILNHCRQFNPDVMFFQENVGSAPVNDVRIMSEAMGVLHIRINSNLVTAQNRDRLYWTNIRTRTDWTGYTWTDISQPEDRKIFLKDIIESGEVDKDKANAILESQSRAQLKQEGLKRRDDKGFITCIKEVIQLNLSTESGGKQPYQQNRIYDINGIAPAVCTQNNGMILDSDYYLRLFTQTELERLQGFPDGWTSILSYNHASSLLGDGWTLPVIEHIFSFLVDN